MEKKVILRNIIGFLLIVVPYSTVNGGLSDNDMYAEQLLAISKGFFIPVMIGFALVWPLFRYKSVKSDYNKIRVVLGSLILIVSLFSFIKLLILVSSFISDYGVSLNYLYAANPDFSARIFLLFVQICIALVLLKPYFNEIYIGLKKLFSQMKKNSDSWNNKPEL